jgi:hypothetical protein
MAGLVWITAPDSFQQWLGNSARSWDHIATRKGATLVGFSRGLMAEFTGRAPVWPLVAIPAMVALAFLVTLLWSKRRIEWSRDLAPILCCSVFTAPYGWAHDHLVLSLVQIGAVGLATSASAAKSTGRLICLYWLAFQLFVLGLSFTFQPAFQFFWFPLGIFLLWLVSSARLSGQRLSGRDNERCGVRLSTAHESKII